MLKHANELASHSESLAKIKECQETLVFLTAQKTFLQANLLEDLSSLAP